LFTYETLVHVSAILFLI